MTIASAQQVLTDRALNRATLHRQFLLRRSAISALESVRHLVGLQAQAANAPYLGLWSRLEAFQIADLTGLIADRRVVRAGSLRGTQHLTTADDYLWLRPLIQRVGLRQRQAAFGRRTAGADLDELAEVAAGLLAGRTLTRPQLRDLLAHHWPDRDAEALAWSVPSVLPVVHPPPSGMWGAGGATPFALAHEWIGRRVASDPEPAHLIRRYLAAFGPASVMDIQVWSGLTRLREVVQRLRPELRTYRNEAGAELFDLPDTPLPDPCIPAPPRFLPQFDNLIVAHANRRRLMTDEDRKRVSVGAIVFPTFLIDGAVAGTWKIRRNRDVVTLVIKPHRRIARADCTALAGEGNRLLTFAAPPGCARDVVFLPAE
jgi:hypothetical protein